MDRRAARAHGRGGAGGGRAARHRGKDVTPFLLGWFHEQTEGASLSANVALALANAGLAAGIAAAERRPAGRSRAPDRERLTARGRS